MPPKKKGAPPKKADDVNIPTEPVQEPDKDGEHILLKLPITDQQLDSLLHDNDMSQVLNYVPILSDPEPYVPSNHFSNDADVLDECHNHQTTNSVCGQLQAITNPSHGCDMVKKGKLCFWCCYEVGHMTYGMPIRYDFSNKSFTMYGTFCSLECAAAHNFSVHLGSDRAWEIHSWIQMLGKRYGFSEPIRPAPSRYLLDLFDGPLTIDEFRNAHKGQTRTYVLNIPPMISVNSQMEIVNTSFLGNTDERSHDKSQKKSHDKRKTIETKMNATLQ